MGPIAGVILHGAITGPLSSVFEPWQRSCGYASNEICPNVIPPIETLIELYLKGLIGQKLMVKTLHMHGADMPSGDSKRAFPALWRASLEASQAIPDMGLLLRGDRMGIIDPDDFQTWMRRHKVRNSKVAGFIDSMNFASLPPELSLVCWNRGKLSEEEVDRIIADHGFKDGNARNAFKDLRNVIPPITDLLSFAQKNVTVPEVVARFQLDAEFDRFWQGQLKDGLTAQGVSEPWARLHWRAHWIRASMSQAQEALQRLRPGRVGADVTFTRADFENVARENDVLPFWRERMRLLAYNPPALRFIRSLFQTGRVNEAEVGEMYQDIGYSPENAPKLAASEAILKLRVLATQGHGYTIAEAIKEYKAEVLDADGVRAVYAHLGYPLAVANEGLLVADQQIKGDLLKILVATLKSQFLHGLTDRPTSIAKLTAIGVNPAHIIFILGVWEAEKELHAPHATLAMLQTWVADGLLTLEDYAKRLVNIGWLKDDIARLVAVQASKLQEHRAHELSRVALEHRRHAMHAYKLAKAMDDADLIESVALVDAAAAEALLSAHTPAEKEAIRIGAKLTKAKVRSRAKRTQAAALEGVEDMPPP